MEHPQQPQQFPQAGYHHHHHQQQGGHGGEGDTGQGGHHPFRRSISHQDGLGGGLPLGAVLPPDLEKITMMPSTRSTDNLFNNDVQNNNHFKFEGGSEAEASGPHHFPPAYLQQQQHPSMQGQATNGGRIRMPFPPIPKIDPIQVSIPSNMIPTSISVHSTFNPPVSGFGTITTTQAPQVIMNDQFSRHYF